MRALIAAFAAGFAMSAAHAEPVKVAREGGAILLLMDDECHMPVKGFPNRALLKNELNQLFTACYRIVGDNIEIVYDDGDSQELPLSIFKPYVQLGSPV